VVEPASQSGKYFKHCDLPRAFPDTASGLIVEARPVAQLAGIHDAAPLGFCCDVPNQLPVVTLTCPDEPVPWGDCEQCAESADRRQVGRFRHTKEQRIGALTTGAKVERKPWGARNAMGNGELGHIPDEWGMGIGG
jgi:hypothetical protein